MKEKPAVTETAILIEKQIRDQKDDATAIRDMVKMRFAMYGRDDANRDVRTFILTFMVKKGPIVFSVDESIYQSLKINAMVHLTHRKGHLVSFDFIKIANEKDVQLLGW